MIHALELDIEHVHVDFEVFPGIVIRSARNVKTCKCYIYTQSFGRSIKGVNFESVDNKPTHLVFLLVAPENSAGIHLKALARISRLLKDSSFRNRLMEAGNRQDLFRIIIEADEKF